MVYKLDIAALQARLEAVQAGLEYLSIKQDTIDNSTTNDTIMTTPSDPSSPMDLETPASENTEMTEESDDSALTCNSNETFDSNTEMSSESGNSDLTYTSNETYDSDTEMTSPVTTPGSIYSYTTTSFSDRSPEIRDARLANALLSLDEDIPMNLDDSIQDLLKNNTNTNTTALGSMAFMVDDIYLDRQEEIAKKKTTTPALPKSKASQARKAAELKAKIDNWDTCPTPTHADW